MSEVSIETFDAVRQVLASGKAQDYHMAVRRNAEDIQVMRAAVERVSSRFPGVSLSPYVNRAIRTMTPERIREAA